MFTLRNVLFCGVILFFESVANNVDNASEIASVPFQTEITTLGENGKTNLEGGDLIRTTEQTVSVKNYDQVAGNLVNKENAISESDDKSNMNEQCTLRHRCATNKTNRLCACDSKCVEYKDCCIDSKYYDETKMYAPLSYICQEFLYDMDRTTHVFVKVDCDPNWTDGRFVELCGVYDDDYYDIFKQNLYKNIPVTGLPSGVTYRNLYCAICNHEKQMRVWNNITFGECTLERTNDTLSLEKIDQNIVVPVYNGLLWQVTFHELPYNCLKGNIYIDEKVERMLDGCINIQVEDPVCSLKTEVNCSATYALVAASNEDDGGDDDDDRSTTVYYRNRYCASCDGLESKLTCPDSGISLNRVLRGVNVDNRSAKATGRLHRGSWLVTSGQFNCNMQEMLCWKVEPQINENNNDTMLIEICNHVSVLLACVHLVVFAMVPELRTLSDKTLASFFVALILYHLAEYAYMKQSFSCMVIMCLNTYSILALFSWILTLAYDIWRSTRMCTRKLRSPSNPKKAFWIYIFCNWILSSMPVLLFVYLYQRDKDLTLPPRLPAYISENYYCVVRHIYLFVFMLILPVLIIMVLTSVFYFHTCYMIFVNSFKSSATIKNDAIKRAVVFIRLGVLSSGFWGIFLVLQAFQFELTFLKRLFFVSQGIIFFCAFTCRKKNYKGVLKRFQINNKTNNIPLNSRS